MSAQVMGTSNSGGGSNCLRRVAMAIYGRQKNQFMDFTFHFMDRVSFSTGFWRFGESMNDLNGKLLLPRPENCCLNFHPKSRPTENPFYCPIFTTRAASWALKSELPDSCWARGVGLGLCSGHRRRAPRAPNALGRIAPGRGEPIPGSARAPPATYRPVCPPLG